MAENKSHDMQVNEWSVVNYYPLIMGDVLVEETTVDAIIKYIQGKPVIEDDKFVQHHYADIYIQLWRKHPKSEQLKRIATSFKKP